MKPMLCLYETSRVRDGLSDRIRLPAFAYSQHEQIWMIALRKRKRFPFMDCISHSISSVDVAASQALLMLAGTCASVLEPFQYIFSEYARIALRCHTYELNHKPAPTVHRLSR